jgi:hypothetical protein
MKNILPFCNFFPAKPCKINILQLMLGAFFLLAGASVYLVSRPIGSTCFLDKFHSIQSFFHYLPDIYGKAGMFAPEFFHALAITLLSLAFVSSRKSRVMICFGWFSINFLFEFGQRYGRQFGEYISEWNKAVPAIKNFSDFFVNGTFDVWDLISIFLGSVTAFCIGELTSKKGEINEKQTGRPQKF